MVEKNKTNILKKSGLYFIGNFSSKIMTSFLVPLYAFYITVEELGKFDFSQTLMNVLVPIVFVAIWEGVLRFILAEKNELKIQKYISSTMGFTIISISIYIAIVFFVNLFSVININDFIWINMMIIFNGISQVWQAYSRALQKNNVYVISGILSTVVNFSLVLLCVLYFKLGVYGLYIPFIMGNITIILYIELKLKLISKFKIQYFDIKLLKDVLKYSSPLVLNLISMWLITGFSRIIIIKNLDVEANGLFAFAMKFSIIVNMIGSVVNMAVIEEAILLVENKELGEKFSKIINEIFEIFLYGLLFFTPFIVIFYKFIGGTEYAESVYIVPPLLLYAVFMSMSTNIGAIFQAKNKTNILFMTTLLGAMITVLGSLFYIDSIGIYAVVIFQLLGVIFMLMIRYAYMVSLVGLKINLVRISILIVIFFVVAYIYIYMSFLTSILVALIVFIFLFYKNKDKILNLVNFKS